MVGAASGSGSGVWSGLDVDLTAAQRSTVDLQVDQVLQERPNAKRISVNEVAWKAGNGAHGNLQSSRAPSKISHVGYLSDNQDWYIHDC